MEASLQVETFPQRQQQQLVQTRAEHVALLALVRVVLVEYHSSGVDGRIGLLMPTDCSQP